MADIRLTMADGHTLEITESAWAKFFDIQLDLTPEPTKEKSFPHGLLILKFGMQGLADGLRGDVSAGQMIVGYDAEGNCILV